MFFSFYIIDIKLYKFNFLQNIIHYKNNNLHTLYKYSLTMTVSNQSYNVARGLVRSKSTAGGAHRILFTNIANDSTVNRFIPGSGVGGLNRSVRRYQYRQATSCTTATGDQRVGRCFSAS
jgi:hypothetical protein